MLGLQLSGSFGFLQETFAAEDATPSESSFMTPAERLDREQDDPDSHKAKKPAIKIPKKLKAKVNPASAGWRCYISNTKDSTVVVYNSRLKACIGTTRQELHPATTCRKLLK